MLKILLLLSSLAYIFFQQGRFDNMERPSIYVAPPQSLKHFHFGYSDSVADSLWIRYIQDMEVCEGKVKDANNRCSKGWSFRLLDAVTSLAPRFRMPHALGGTNLAIISNDQEGAAVIFERGINNFGNDWPILYRASYFYLYEMENKPKAASLLDKAAQAGAPLWVSSLASRIWSKVGELELGIRSLKDYQSRLFSDKQKADVQKRIDHLLAEYKKINSK